MAKTTLPADQLAAEKAHLDAALSRFRAPIVAELQRFVTAANSAPDVAPFYGQMAYHLGWMDEDLASISPQPGKLLRPALVLWACELACHIAGVDDAEHARRHEQALPAAVAVELVHNFSLIHDDIEDHDELRRHRKTLWSIWGEAQGINTGDGMFALARLALWETVARGYPAAHAVRLAETLDRTALQLCEGQFLDMANEARAQVTPAQYLRMIAGKTAALMRCATEIGGRIGAPDHAHTYAALAEFGEALGIAFQIRDDLLGIWADTAELGKTAAGDLRRKKMSLPVIHALASAEPAERITLLAIYQAPGPATDAQIAMMLKILNHASRQWCRAQLRERCAQAVAALQRSWDGDTQIAASEPAQALAALVRYIAIAGRQ